MRRVTVIAAVVLGLAVVSPVAAGARTELGQLQAANQVEACEGTFSLVQRTTSASASYAVPAGGGVITGWRHRAAADEGSEDAAGGRLQVWRQTGAGYQLVGRSAFEAFAPGVVNEFATEIPVAAGDLIGLRATGKPHACASKPIHGATDVAAGAQFDNNLSDPEPGFTWIPQIAIPSSRVNVAATLDVIELGVEADTKQKVKELEVTVGCGAVACDAELSGKAVAKKGKPRRGGPAAASGKRKQKFGVAPVTLEIPAGETVTELVRLKKSGKLRKLLRNKAFRRKTKAKIAVTATDAAGNAATEQAKVKLKP